MKVYFSSKSKWHPWVSALVAANVPISSTWHLWPANLDDTEPTHDDWAEHSARCLREAAECDILILFAQRGEVHFGAVAEAAAALAHDRTVFLVAPDHDWSFLRCNKNVRSFDNLGAAIQAVMAMERGERLRAA
jgi:hypothetical protein